MITPWDRLGLAPTGDVAAIKRAYAVRLKHTRPDDNALAYQDLREAYDWALGYARWCKDDPEALREAPAEAEVVPAEAPRQWRAPDPLAAWAPAGAAVMGEAAGSPARFVSVQVDPRPPTGAPRSRRRRRIALGETTAVVAAEGEPVSASGAIVAELAAMAASPDPLGGWAQLRERLDRLPIAAQDEVDAVLAHFVIDRPELPPVLVSKLAAHLGWGKDFRLEQLIGAPAALRLYECIAAARAAAPGFAHVAASFEARERYAHLLHTARCFDTGRMLRFWSYVVLSPMALFGDVRDKAAQAVMEDDAIDWRRVKRLIDGVFVLTLVFLALALSAVQQPDGLFGAVPAWGLPALLLAGGALGFALVMRLPSALAACVHRRWSGSGIGSWLAAARQGKRFPWVVLGAIAALIPGAFVAAEHYVGVGTTGPSAEAALILAVGVPLLLLMALIWPIREAWESLVLPAAVVVSAFIAQALDSPFAWAIALPIGCLWIAAANLLVLRAPRAVEAVFLSPFSVLRPNSPGGWLLFALFMKGVLAFYAALFIAGTPAALFAYARLYGGPRAYLALCCAAVLFFSGWLPPRGWSAILWLLSVLFGFSLLSRLAGWLLTRPLLAQRG